MKKVLSLVMAIFLTVSFCVAFSSCTPKETSEASSIADAKSIADLKGMKISAQAGTFHADALEQIEDVKSSTYPEFADLLTALQSGAIDGYISEEPTAIEAVMKDDTLDYLKLKNNDTGFTAEKEDTSIAVGVKTDSELRDKINAVLTGITEKDKSALMDAMIKLSSGKKISEIPLKSEPPAKTKGTLKVAMECAYQPYNWTVTEGGSIGEVKIFGEGKEGLTANGYDVQIAQYIANKLDMKLEVYSDGWDSLIPGLNAGTYDAIIAGMSPTAEREEQIDFSDAYYESNLVVIYKK